MIRIIMVIQECENGRIDIKHDSYKIDEETPIEKIIANAVIGASDRVVEDIIGKHPLKIEEK